MVYKLYEMATISIIIFCVVYFQSVHMIVNQ